nr:unnamed protein product [Callosobruchus analis]
MGNKGDTIVFSESEWKEFLDYQNVISHQMYTTEANSPIHTSSCSIHFICTSGTPVVKLSKGDSVIYWAYDSLLDCGICYHILQNGLQTQGGDLITDAVNLLHSADSCPTENTTVAMEFLYMYEDSFEEECQRQ